MAAPQGSIRTAARPRRGRRSGRRWHSPSGCANARQGWRPASLH
ncbi:hypothetical protein [Pseudomonas sp. No.117]